MAVPTLDATPGGLTSNSYCTVAEGDAYHDARLFATDWTTATVAAKTVALIEATRLLDSMYEWAEWPRTTPQALQWPRIGILARNRWKYVDFDKIPDELKNATAEFARQLIVADRTLDSDIETQGITSLSAGSVSLAFKPSQHPKVVPDAVYNLIPHWWGFVRGRDYGQRTLVRA